MQNLELKELMRLGFKIEYKKGKDNVAAYALSRKDSHGKIATMLTLRSQFITRAIDFWNT